MEALSAQGVSFQEQTILSYNLLVLSIDCFRLQITEEFFPQQEDILL
jgi:hypothetical protein